MTRCTYATHSALRSSVEAFRAGTESAQTWAGHLLMAHCRECGSSLCLYICVLCGDCCEEGDALPWGPEDTDAHAHFSCVARVQLSTAKTRFVIVAGKGRAAEFCRDTIGTVRS